MSSRTQSGGMFRSLGVRNYRIYFLGSLASNTGTWMQRTAQYWLVLELSGGSPVALGITTFLQFAPTLLLSLYAGMLADRMEKQKLLALTQGSLGVAALALGLLDWTGAVQLWQVYVLAGILGAITAMDAPPRQAFASELVGRDHLANAVSLNSASFNMARLTGPAVAGVLIGLLGTGPVFILQTVAALVIVWALSRIDTKALFRTPPVERKPGQLREALRYTIARMDLVLAIGLGAMVSLFGLNLQVITPLMAREVFGRGAAEFGLLSSALAIGTLGGALLAARRIGAPRQRLLVGAAIAFGLIEVVLAVMPTYWTFAAVLIPTGALSMSFMLAANTSVQIGLDPDMRGRVMSLFMLFFMGGGALGSLMIGWISDMFGVRTAIAVGGMVTALAGIVVALLLAQRGGLRMRAHIVKRPHFEIGLGRRVPDLEPAVESPRG